MAGGQKLGCPTIFRQILDHQPKLHTAIFPPVPVIVLFCFSPKMKIQKRYNKHLTEVQKAYIVGLSHAGMSSQKITEKTGIPKTTVNNTITTVRKALKEGILEPFKEKPRSERPHLLDLEATQKPVRHSVAHPKTQHFLLFISTLSKSDRNIS